MQKEKLQQFATELQCEVQQRGYERLTVNVQRGHAVVKIDGQALARFSPGPGNELQLSYHNHTGRWEPMPFTARKPGEAAQLMLDILAPHIQAFCDF